MAPARTLRRAAVRQSPVDDFSDGRVPAAVELARQLADVDRARRERRVAAQRARTSARAAIARYDAARAVGWSDDQLAAAGLVPSGDILDLAHQPDDPEV